MSGRDAPLPTRRGPRLTPRRVAEWVATALIVAGIAMMVQPVWLTFYTYSFVVTLAGTLAFVFGSKLPG